MFEMPVLTTKRLTLRAFEAEDAPALYALVSDRRIAATTLNIPHPYPEDGALTFILRARERAASGEGFSFAVVQRTDGTLLGAAGLHPRHALQAEMGYWMGVPYWGQGYASEAARRLIAFGFDTLGLNRIYASYFANNPASAGVMRKAGMIYEGAMKGHILKWGEYLDLGYYSILRADYEAQPS
jgi:RimJ/RimL family protein N-acetyltransferase